MRFVSPINLCDDSTDFEQARFLLKTLTQIAFYVKIQIF